jgi:alkylation response protein AidB-like acyl-CoA dehydrogenase
MNFDFSEEQKELKEHAGKFLREQCNISVVRRILEGDEAYAEDLWKAVVEMGWPAVALPEEYGGIGFGYLELCVIAEELGKVVAPVPFSSSVYLATEAILLGGNDAQKQEYLPKLAGGELIGTLALSEGPRVANPDTIAVTFEGGKLNGTKIPVPDGDIANIAVVAAKSGSGISLVLVDLSADGVSRDTVATLDPTRSHAKVSFKDAPATVLGDGDNWEVLERVLDRAAVLIAFEQIGGADTCMRMAREYSIGRYAFGRPIGSFQALKHRMAEMYVKNELARSNAYYGAWALSTDAPELPVAAASARVSATDAYHFASKENIQIHGGIGFTWEADCHFYYRRAKLLSLCLGSVRVWKDRLITNLEAQRSA